jgi:hypothetical protein
LDPLLPPPPSPPIDIIDIVLSSNPIRIVETDFTGPREMDDCLAGADDARHVHVGVRGTGERTTLGEHVVEQRPVADLLAARSVLWVRIQAQELRGRPVPNHPGSEVPSATHEMSSNISYSIHLYSETCEIRTPLGRAKSAPNSEVSSFHTAICTENTSLGPDEVS